MMAGETVTCTFGAPEGFRVRLKPDIYQTVDGKVIVEDEFLHFLFMKLKTLGQDEIAVLAANTFDSEWIEMSKETLFDVCATTQCNVSHTGANKDVNNIKTCLEVLNECGNNIPRFVSHYLDEMPPVTFTSMDMCSLLRKMEQLQAEVCAMQHTMKLQSEVSEGLRAITVNVSNRVCALELRTGQGDPPPEEKPLITAGDNNTEEETNTMKPESSAEDTQEPSTLQVERCVEYPGGSVSNLPESPKSNQDVKQEQILFAVTTESAPHHPPDQREEDTTMDTGAAGSIERNKTKRVLRYRNKKVSCEECGKVVSDSCALKTHYRSHTVEKPFMCQVCGKGFRSRGHRKEHSRIHTGEKPYKCTICPRRFAQSSALKYHIRNHTGIKPYKCEICQKEFRVSSALKVHARIHTGEKIFKCEVCGHRCNTSGAIKSHMKTHTGERPYECELCGHSFAEKGGFIRHCRVHTGEKPYKCEYCEKNFAGMSNLKKHLRTHTGEKPYKCDVCGQVFIQSSNLKIHMKVHSSKP